jgi:2-dehydro-3-deoxygalactonokinase
MKFVAIDWGTSSFRAWLIEHDQIQDYLESDQGVKNFVQGQHISYLITVLEPWAQRFDFIVSIGMIGSSIGLFETKFSKIPIDLNGVVKSLIKVPDINPALYIIPGVQKLGDVMRGEESQTLASGLKDGIVVLPGTHSKWVMLEKSVIVDFRTFFTGELFELLRNHSTLSKATNSSERLKFSSEFVSGLDANSDELTHNLFSIRASWLQGKSEDASREYLSGLLIGAEIKSARKWCNVSEVLIIASESLTEIYTKSLAHFGISAREKSPDELIDYFVEIAKKLEYQI